MRDTVVLETQIDAPPAVVWSVLDDFEGSRSGAQAYAGRASSRVGQPELAAHVTVTSSRSVQPPSESRRTFQRGT